MRSSGYRTPSVIRIHSEKRMSDRDLLPVFFALWIASAIRVVIALLNEETFGTEPTLAFFALLLVPVLLFSRLFARHSPRE